MTPALVEPAEATTADTGRGWPASAVRSAPPVITPSAPVGTTSARRPSRRSALATDEWAVSATATHRSPAGGPRLSRATASALRFPADPPLTKQPPAHGGRPAELGQEAQDLVLGVDRAGGLQPALPREGRGADDGVEERAAAVGAAGMKARNRGLSRPTVAGAITSSKRRNASAAPSPSSVMVRPSAAASAAGAGGRAERRPAGQTVATKPWAVPSARRASSSKRCTGGAYGPPAAARRLRQVPFRPLRWRRDGAHHHPRPSGPGRGGQPSPGGLRGRQVPRCGAPGRRRAAGRGAAGAGRGGCPAAPRPRRRAAAHRRTGRQRRPLRRPAGPHDYPAPKIEDRFEITLVHVAIELQVPTVAICRGHPGGQRGARRDPPPAHHRPRRPAPPLGAGLPEAAGRHHRAAQRDHAVARLPPGPGVRRHRGLWRLLAPPGHRSPRQGPARRGHHRRRDGRGVRA